MSTRVKFKANCTSVTAGTDASTGFPKRTAVFAAAPSGRENEAILNRTPVAGDVAVTVVITDREAFESFQQGKDYVFTAKPVET